MLLNHVEAIIDEVDDEDNLLKDLTNNHNNKSNKNEVPLNCKKNLTIRLESAKKNGSLEEGNEWDGENVLNHDKFQQNFVTLGDLN